MEEAIMKALSDSTVQEFMHPYPLRSEADYDRALKEIEPLVVKSKLSPDERDFLDVMTILIEHYEDDHYRIEEGGLTRIDLLRYLMEENGLSGADLGRILGNRTEGYPILRGERELTKNQMRKLGEYFQVPAGLFL
jgi:HTH-type transcriptional regulator/antitoxin HigA